MVETNSAFNELYEFNFHCMFPLHHSASTQTKAAVSVCVMKKLECQLICYVVLKYFLPFCSFFCNFAIT